METPLIFSLERDQNPLIGAIRLDGSKSISNRVLMIHALCNEAFPIRYLSTSNDTVTMQQLLDSDESVLDTGPAGTTYRFLTAFYALQEGTQILTGSDRMKNRPIGPLVDALRSIGANIQYLESEGYPPLQIQPPTKLGMHRQVKVQAGISSQFISALLMIAPSLPSGLDVILEGSMVSRSYLEMTLSLMSHFGVNHKWSGNTISIAAQKYRPKPFEVEGDWSAASYHYTNTVFAVSAELELKGLFKNSWQGDATSLDLFDRLGVQSTWTADGVVLTKKERQVQVLDHNFINCPDIAQTMSVVCAGLGVPGIFSGLDTLNLKETDRIKALQTELAKIGTAFVKMPPRFRKKERGETYLVEGKAHWTEVPVFQTYEDHRMAMAFAPLGMLNTVKIDDPAVVGKSYPGFWRDLISLDWRIQLG